MPLPCTARRGAAILSALLSLASAGSPAAAPDPPAIAVEAEDFQPLPPPDHKDSAAGWRVLRAGHGNYMVDTVGPNHISGERLLSAPAAARGARARLTVRLPAPGDYRVWARFEQPTRTSNRFRVEVYQGGRLRGFAVLGERDAPKFFAGLAAPVPQADPSWGSEGLADQSFDVPGLAAGVTELVLVALPPDPAAPADTQYADRNLDLLYLTRDRGDGWRRRAASQLYPILDAAQAALPPRYLLRVTAPADQELAVAYSNNREPWRSGEGTLPLRAGVPSAWLPLRRQDVCHFSTLVLRGRGPGLRLRAELAQPGPGAAPRPLRSIDWDDPESPELLIGLPPYPDRGEPIVTVEEQYQGLVDYLALHPSLVGQEPHVPLAQVSALPVWEPGRVGDAAAALFHALGLRGFLGLLTPGSDQAAVDRQVAIARRRFAGWGLPENRSVALVAYRQSPTAENLQRARDSAVAAGVLQQVQRFDYGDEIALWEWLAALSADELAAGFTAWQRQHRGTVSWPRPDSSADAASRDPALYVDSLRFYEDAAIRRVAALARRIPAVLGPAVRYGANISAHPFYYPDLARFIKWFRGGAANFGRHSEYFWQVGQPGPLVNGYLAEHFRAGMRDDPRALLWQYTMPHSPGNSDADFVRSALTHLAHGARGLDYFGVGVNHSFTENFIDFRDPQRFAAVREVNRLMATIEDLLPESRVQPSRVALLLSDSSERWDFAAIARDRAAQDVFGRDYQQARLAFHQERVGLYYALVHDGHPPDLLTEDDVQAGRLAGYDAAYWVGDCAEARTVDALAAFAQGGGRLIATAGALRFDEYHRPLLAGAALLGLGAAELLAQTWFFRPQIELPRLVPLDHIDGMPVLALQDRVAPAPGSQVTAYTASGNPGIVEHPLGRGRVTFIAALPGVAYLWGAYQPPPVPSRGPSSHATLTGFQPDAGRLLTQPLAAVPRPVDAHGAWLDARLLLAPGGAAVPLANYAPDVQTEVTVTLRAPRPITAVRSARRGPLVLAPVAGEPGAVTVRYRPGLGDILRLELAASP